MWWLQVIRFIHSYVSFAKEPNENRPIFLDRPSNFESLQRVATGYGGCTRFVGSRNRNWLDLSCNFGSIYAIRALSGKRPANLVYTVVNACVRRKTQARCNKQSALCNNDARIYHFRNFPNMAFCSPCHILFRSREGETWGSRLSGVLVGLFLKRFLAQS